MLSSMLRNPVYGRIAIPEHNNHRRLPRHETISEALYNTSSLFSMGRGANLEIDVFMWNFKNIEKVMRHFIIVMLTCMNEAELQLVFVLELPDQRSDLDKIRSSAHRQIQSAVFTGGIVKPHLF